METACCARSDPKTSSCIETAAEEWEEELRRLTATRCMFLSNSFGLTSVRSSTVAVFKFCSNRVCVVFLVPLAYMLPCMSSDTCFKVVESTLRGQFRNESRYERTSVHEY